MIQSVIPKGIKKAVKKLIGITALNEQIMAINSQLKFFQEILYGGDVWERSRKRWRESEPEKGLTWRKEISGDNFIKKLQSYATFNKKTQILEIGPGYGRLLKSFLGMKLDFKKYVCLDISEKDVNFLRSIYKEKTIEFILGDVENFSFNEKFDVVFSSLTFKHLFPTFENALKNLIKCMEQGGIIMFDLIEGDICTFENDLVTYLRSYSKEKVIEILENVHLELIAFDQVEHTPGYIRLLVVAKK
jgi:SAM-dependent methyltransferase